MKKLIIFLFVLLYIFFGKSNLYAQKYLIGFSFEPGFTKKTTNASQLDETFGGFLINTPDGSLNYEGKFTYQSGINLRYVLKNYYLLVSLSTFQNYITLTTNGSPIPGTLRIPMINPGVSLIRRIQLRHGIELNWQVGLSTAFSLTKRFAGIYTKNYQSFNNGDTTISEWQLNMNANRNMPKIAAQTAITLMIPISRNWNCEFGAGFFHELNKPTAISYSSKYKSTNPPLNLSQTRSFAPINERYFYLKLGVLREIHVKQRK